MPKIGSVIWQRDRRVKGYAGSSFINPDLIYCNSIKLQSDTFTICIVIDTP